MKKIFIFFLFLITLNANAIEKETTFNQKLFNKAQSEGKIVIISSWIKYCSSCAGQMKILKEAKIDGKLNDIKFYELMISDTFGSNDQRKKIINTLKINYRKKRTTKKYIYRFAYILLSASVILSLFINLRINEISKELSLINTEIIELERSKANLNIEYIRKYSFENIENLSKLKSYVRLRVSNLNLDLETPYKANTEDVQETIVMGFGR